MRAARASHQRIRIALIAHVSCHELGISAEAAKLCGERLPGA
jgi:hypothetical protein